MFKKLYITAAIAAAAFSMTAQVTSTPPLLQEDSKDVVIYFHADQGNQGLMNQPSTAQIYAHTGVITNKSTSASDWKYAPTWGDNNAKYKLDYVSPNLWKLNIGDLRSYYNITDASEQIEKLAFVFRNSTNTLEGKGVNNTDIFLDVLPDGLQVLLLSDNQGNVITAEHPNITFNLYCTEAAELTLTVNDRQIGSASGATELTAANTFTTSGNYTVTGTAKVGSQTVATSLQYVLPTPSQPAIYPGGVPKMGAVKNADGSVTFCLAAPQKSSAMIVGSWDDYQLLDQNTMAYQDYQNDRYFWITVPGLESGKDYMYYYLVDGNLRVGHPYARLVLDPYNDKYIPESVYPNLPAYPYEKFTDIPLAIYNDTLNDYDWQVKDFKGVDKSQLFIYELLVRDFTGTEGKALGDGTIRGALAKLPYLKAMGVNAIELLPINEFNGNNSWGYNPNFYFAPDKAYGTPDDYKEFIDACHANGIAVILDMVFNQTDWLHPWYKLYPVGSNPFYNASAPHAYSVLNDWRQEYPLVRQQFKDVLKYWLTEYKVDGFRFDLVKGLGNNSSYANNGDAATNAFNQSRIDNMHELQQAMEEVNPNAYFINENLAGAQEENAMAAFGQLNWANVNTQGGQYAMGYASNSGLDRFYAPNDSRTWGSTVSYLESHDEQRLAYMQNTNGASGIKGSIVNSMHRLGSAAAQMMMAPGAHMVWMFSELGNPQNNKDASGGNNTDPKTVNWKYFDNANRHGLYEDYAQLALVRAKNPEMFGSDVQVSLKCSTNDWNAGRSIVLTNGSKQIILAVNPNTSGDPINISVPFKTFSNDDYQLMARSYDTTPSYNASAGYITVAPNCYAVVGSKDLVEVEEVIGDSARMHVIAADGMITIEGATAPVSIYNLAGQLLYSAEPAAQIQVPLDGGIYIVRSGRQAVKTALR